jgi:WD40 repeat protein
MFPHWTTIVIVQVMCLAAHDLTVSDVGWSADSTSIVSGSYDRTTRVWDIAAGNGVAVDTRYATEKNLVAVFFTRDEILFAPLLPSPLFISWRFWKNCCADQCLGLFSQFPSIRPMLVSPLQRIPNGISIFSIADRLLESTATVQQLRMSLCSIPTMYHHLAA